MEAYLREDFCSGPFSTSKMDARELYNDQRREVKSRRGGEARTGKRWRSEAWARRRRTFCFRGMLSTVHSGTSLLLIRHLKPVSKAA